MSLISSNPYAAPKALAQPEVRKIPSLYLLTLIQLTIHGLHVVLRRQQDLGPDSAPNPYLGWSTACLLVSATLACFIMNWCVAIIFSRRKLPLLMWPWVGAIVLLGLQFVWAFCQFVFL